MSSSVGCLEPCCLLQSFAARNTVRPAVCRYVKGGLSRSLTVRNLQLSLYGLPFSMAYMWLKDGVTRTNVVQVSHGYLVSMRQLYELCTLAVGDLLGAL
jgi:hypothetical protein